MNGLFNYPGGARIPQMPTRQRQQIPGRGEPGRMPQMGMSQPQMGMNQPGMGMPQMMGNMGGSQGLFHAYMQQLFNRKYAPPQMPGGVQNMGGFMGFGSPKMTPLAPPQQGGLMSIQPGTTPQTSHYAEQWNTGG
jgi:hypothetical protein